MPSLPVAARLLKRFTDAALEAQMSPQRATNEALKAWMASRPKSEQQGVALVKVRLRALATREKQKREARAAARRRLTEQSTVGGLAVGP